MPKSRAEIPKRIRDSVLFEFSHRCAICGADRPQIHHIDENPGNNAAENLVPLCANHHLSDQHNPTTKYPELRLSLFRRYKDPQILCPQFAPLYSRLLYLMTPIHSMKYDELVNHSHDLVRFVKHLQMGEYYSAVLRELLDWSWQRPYASEERQAFLSEQEERYQAQVARYSNRILELVIEQLRYQAWPMYNGLVDRSMSLPPTGH